MIFERQINSIDNLVYQLTKRCAFFSSDPVNFEGSGKFWLITSCAHRCFTEYQKNDRAWRYSCFYGLCYGSLLIQFMVSTTTPSRYDTPDPTLCIRDIPRIAGDHMAIRVPYRLNCRSAYVEPDIVTIRMMRFFQEIFALHNEINHCMPLIIRH